MTDGNFLVNDLYPIDYFSLPGTASIPFPDSGQWISQARYSSVGADKVSFLPVSSGGTQTSEILEFDLGYVRTINYVTFDIQQAPIDIKLEYDVVSSPGQPRAWVQVTPMVDMPFGNRIQYNPQSLHGWFHDEMYFTDSKQNPVQSRYLRFTFTRRNDSTFDSGNPQHPLGIKDPLGSPYPWPVTVQNLRVGLFTQPSTPIPGSGSPMGIVEATGLLFYQEPIGLIPFFPDVDESVPGGITGTQVRQRFVIPESMVRVDNNNTSASRESIQPRGQNALTDGSLPATNTDQTVPDIVGFGVFVNVPIPETLGDIDENYLKDKVKFGWSIVDVTDPTIPIVIRSGTETGAHVFGDQWIDVYFAVNPPTGEPNKPPIPSTYDEMHCGMWMGFGDCGGVDTPGEVHVLKMYWYWHDLTTGQNSVTPPPGAPAGPVPAPGQEELWGGYAVPDPAKYDICAVYTFLPQSYCYTVQQPTPPPGKTYCGRWVAWKSFAIGKGGYGAFWLDTDTGQKSLTKLPGAPEASVAYPRAIPQTDDWQETAQAQSGPGYTTPYCWPPSSITTSGGVSSITPPPQPVPLLLNNKVYELRVWSLDTTVADMFYISEPNNLSDRQIPGTMTFVHESTTVTTSEDVRSTVHVGDWIMVSGIFATVESGDEQLEYQVESITANTITLASPYLGQTVTAPGLLVYALYGWDGSAYIPDGHQNLVMRLWGNTGSTGQDVLGNSYRYATKEKMARDVQVNSKAGWISAAMPTQNAVEALYFDVRDLDDEGKFVHRVLDAVTIAPLTPGLQMSIYYSKSNLQGTAPQTIDDWDYLLWTPVSNHTFTLNRKQRITFPFQIKASYMKLEFTALQPLPWRVPTFPPLPPQVYRRYPTWIEQQFENSQVRQTVQDWWLRNSTPVQVKILNTLRSPIREFEYEEGLMYAYLALGTPPLQVIPTTIVAPVNASIQENSAGSSLDPVTGRQIWLETGSNLYANSLLRAVDQTTVLGQTTIARNDPTLANAPLEKRADPVPASTGSVQSVSTAGPRISNAFSFLANTPMRFNTPCRHVYKQEWGEFHKKAYFAGINMVQFERTDFMVKHDDIVIRDVLHDDQMLERNTWMRSDSSAIADGDTVFVSYRVDNTDYVDEELTLNGYFPVPLEGKGANLFNVLVYSLHEHFGIQYFENDDYEIVLGIDTDLTSPTYGKRTYAIARSQLSARLEVPPHPQIYKDVSTVQGYGFLGPANTWDDTDTIVGTGLALTFFERLAADTPGFGTATFGAGNFGEL